MRTYFITETITQQGKQSIDEAPARSQGVEQAAGGYGVRLLEWFFTPGGEFDFIMKVEAPDDESVEAFVMAVQRTGNVHAAATRAYTPPEWKEIVGRLG